MQHGLTVVSRDTGDYERARVPVRQSLDCGDLTDFQRIPPNGSPSNCAVEVGRIDARIFGGGFIDFSAGSSFLPGTGITR